MADERDGRRQSDRARSLEQAAIDKAVEARKRAESVRDRIDAGARELLPEVEDVDTGIHLLSELVGEPKPKTTSPERPDLITPTLPSMRAAPPPPSEEPTPTTLPRGLIDAEKPRDEHIAVADDDRDLANDIANELREEGYKVRVAHDGIEALETVLKHRPLPDALVLDMGLPFLSGDGVIAALLTRPELVGFPILIISGDPPERLPAHVVREFVFVRKPFTHGRRELMMRTLRERIAEWRIRPRGGRYGR